ncbi:MAG: putative protease sohB [Pseudomonadota bacterium]|jgi:signal peptide peptidase SppA
MKKIFSKPKKIIKKILRTKEKKYVSVLNMHGVIGKDSKFESGINFQNLEPLIKKAFDQENLKAIALCINSPGGSPVQSELIYNYLRELSIAKKIPIYSFAQDVAASGGYWLLSAGDEIYAHNSSIIGSIGVIFSSFGFVDLIKKIGIDRRVYTEGKNKAILDPFLPEQQENIAILKAVQKDIFENFVSLVKERRLNKLNSADDQLFNGAFWSGKQALELGLIDGIADFRSKMQEKYGHDVEFIKISSKKSFLKNLFSEKTNLVEKFFDNLEEKISFNKFGL